MHVLDFGWEEKIGLFSSSNETFFYKSLFWSQDRDGGAFSGLCLRLAGLFHKLEFSKFTGMIHGRRYFGLFL